MIPESRENSNAERTVAYDCGHTFVYTGVVVIESRCPACDAPMAGRP